VRLALEILGTAAVAAGTCLAALVMLWATTSRELEGGLPQVAYLGAIVLGYAAVLAVSTVGRRPSRERFDAFLVTWFPAAAIVAAMLEGQWPIDLTGWDAHGMGATGAEANAALLPWIHAALIPTFLAAAARLRRRADGP
jgi:hypothetical protein